MINENDISVGDWCEKELSAASIKDKRLNKRFVKITEDLSKNPSAPINQACGDWASTKAAYSFFDNNKVSPEKILEPHFENTAARMGNHKIVLAIQDTTTLNYASHESVTLGHIGKEGTSGLMQHNTLVVSSEGMPLGLIDQKCWSRTLTPEEKKALKATAIEEKESFRWIESLRKTNLRSPANTTVVTVCDREADIYEFLDESEKLNSAYLIRLKHNREIEDSNMRIKSYLKSRDISDTYEIKIPKKKGEYPERVATVVIRYASITINAPEHLNDEIENSEIEMTGIHVEELNPPEGANPISWYLLTNFPVLSAADAIKMVAWYKLRWLVEVFHKTEKSCCHVEDCRLETEERLRKYLALKSIIAWRVLFMTHIARLEPKESAETILAPSEIKVLEGIVSKGLKKPKKIKNVRQAVHAIASLGGYLQRKSDKDPGIIVICRGIQRLHDFTDGFILAAALRTYG